MHNVIVSDVMQPAGLRQCIARVRETLSVSERMACQVVGQARSTQRHPCIDGEEENALAKLIVDAMLDGNYKRPDVTARALRDGLYWSGDLGFEMDGELYAIGRKKDLITVRGENIYPQDIEEIISRHLSIVAAVGR
jgi:acyl-CoA synthetase (AMP-forming)/AMP-acid ligase II